MNSSSISTTDHHHRDEQELPSVNILMIGSSQSGKSTLIKVLKDPNYKSSHSGFSETKQPCFDSFPITDSNSPDAIVYRLNVIDTPGLREIRRQTNETRTDDELLSKLKTFITDHIDRLHCLCFVTEAGRTQQKDVEIFEKLMNFFGPELSKYSMMILTHAEQYTDEKLQEFVNNIENHPSTRKIYHYCKLGIYYHGVVDYDELATFADKQDIQRQMIEVKRQRVGPMTEKLIQKLIQCRESSIQSQITSNQSARESSIQNQITSNQSAEERALLVQSGNNHNGCFSRIRLSKLCYLHLICSILLGGAFGVMGGLILWFSPVSFCGDVNTFWIGLLGHLVIGAGIGTGIGVCISASICALFTVINKKIQ